MRAAIHSKTETLGGLMLFISRRKWISLADGILASNPTV